MIVLRSVLFALVLAVLTPLFALLGLLGFWLPRHARHRLVTAWAPVTLWFVQHLLGIRHRVIGLENIPPGPAVILCKHQSAWETIALQTIFPPMAFVLKRELLKVPFFGWGLAQTAHIAIDRGSPKEALKQVVEQGKARLEEGFWVTVFPEGTRVAPGAHRRYQPGGALLAAKAGVPIVPVAHNAGEFWRRNAFLKYPGEIVLSIGKPIDPTGRQTSQLAREVEDWVEGEMHRLFPHHYVNGVVEELGSDD